MDALELINKYGFNSEADLDDFLVEVNEYSMK